MKKYLTIVVILLLVAVLLVFGHNPNQNNNQYPSISIGNNVISVEIANTDAERTLGLGGRDSLPENHGMLFVFDHSDIYGFWMKDTHFPLDFIWIDQNKKIVDLTENVSPSSYPKSYYPKVPVKYVLEVNASFVKNHQISVGESLDF